MKAGDDVGGSVYDPKEQAIGKAPAPGAAHISENDRELLRRGSNSLDNRFDLGSKASGQLRAASSIPIASFEYFRLCRRCEYDRRHG